MAGGERAADEATRGQLPTLLGSAAAGMIGRVFCHPLDTIKARRQASTAAAAPLRAQLQLRGLYRGLGVSVLGSAPATCVYLSAYEAARDSLAARSALCAAHPSLLFLSAGMAAEAVSCVLWVPIDVIKERLQVQARPGRQGGNGGVYYRDALHAARRILRAEGLTGLYRGYGATLLSFGPFSALYFLFYEQAKAAVRSRLGGEELAPRHALVSAAAAGAAASLLTNPLDLVKLRLQVQRAAAADAPAGAAPPYRGVLDGLARVIRIEGPRALFKGAGARVAFHAPSTAITMALFESCRRAFAALLDA